MASQGLGRQAHKKHRVCFSLGSRTSQRAVVKQNRLPSERAPGRLACSKRDRPAYVQDKPSRSPRLGIEACRCLVSRPSEAEAAWGEGCIAAGADGHWRCVIVIENKVRKSLLCRDEGGESRSRSRPAFQGFQDVSQGRPTCLGGLLAGIARLFHNEVWGPPQHHKCTTTSDYRPQTSPLDS